MARTVRDDPSAPNVGFRFGETGEYTTGDLVGTDNVFVLGGGANSTAALVLRFVVGSRFARLFSHFQYPAYFQYVSIFSVHQYIFSTSVYFQYVSIFSVLY